MDLPIFSDNLKSSASWADLLAGEREAWDNARQAPDARAQIDARTRREQIENALRRAGRGIDGQRLGGSPTVREGVDTDPCPPSRSGYRQRLLEAASLVSAWAADPEAKFGVERLLDLHRTVIGAPAGMDVLRKTEPTPINATHEPTPALLLPRMLDNAFDWFDTESFRDLRPVERAAVVYLRLLDLHPFSSYTETTATLAAGFYTEREGMPPLVIFADDLTQARYARALEAAFRMLTQPLVELFAEMLTRTMRIGLGPER
ncbi:MAG TPA: Fic family protein [Blastocatellia bacterium]|nr:Fic family protein [Blastocatellia bacterium]